MSTSAEVFQQWTDFPKGLRVLVLDRDTRFLRDIAHTLESHQYCVTTFSSEEEAYTALGNHKQPFHVALVEAAENHGLDSRKILSFSKDVPTIMMSALESMPLMVKLIALGAVEFLVKPLLDDKLRNIWQHVIRKALDSSRETLRPGYLERGKSTSASLVVEEDHQISIKNDTVNPQPIHEEKGCHSAMGAYHSLRLSVPCEGLAEPSTPQLEQGGRIALQESTVDESPRSHDSTEVCNYKERVAPQTASKSFFAKPVDVKEVANEPSNTTVGSMAVKTEDRDFNEQPQIFCCSIPMLESVLHETSNTSQMPEDTAVDLDNSSKNEGLVRKALHCDIKEMSEACELSSTDDYEPQEARSSSVSQLKISKDSAQCPNADSTCQSETLGQDQDKGNAEDDNKSTRDKGGKDTNKSTKKKVKVDWTADLHRRFVQAVEYLGVEHAIPSRILEVMKVEGLTRHNVASHLQKYRSHKKHLRAREAEVSKLNSPGPWSSCAGQSVQHQMWIQPRPQVIGGLPLHVWGHPKVDNPAASGTLHLMPQYIAPAVAAWPVFIDPLSWKPPMADSWATGLLSMAPCYGSYPGLFTTSGYPAYKSGSTCCNTWRSFHEDLENANPDDKNRSNKSDSQDLYPPKELLDAAISEALSNPWTPLPLGLKPPSMESVMAELERQGMTTLSSSD